MRSFTVNLLCGLVALAGFAGSAAATATIDLIWAATGTDTISGAQATSANIVLNVVLTAGPGSSDGAGISIDYSSLVGTSSVVTFASNQVAPLNIGLGTTTDSAGVIHNMNALCLGINCLPSGSSFLLGTITFTGLTGAGSFTITPFVDTASTDGVLDGFGSDISATSIFNNAFVNVVPEPGTFSLLGMGLAGLYAVGRRSSRKR